MPTDVVDGHVFFAGSGDVVAGNSVVDEVAVGGLEASGEAGETVADGDVAAFFVEEGGVLGHGDFKLVNLEAVERDFM
jgi:hypothetical protein